MAESTRPVPVRWHRFLPYVLMVVGSLVYLNSLEGRFVFDDILQIRDDLTIRNLWPPGPLLQSARPLVQATMALNYALDGLNVAGYHFLNIVIHITAALALFGVIRITCQSPAYGDRLKAAAPWLAFGVAVLWMVHPLATQAVNYVIQRGESMMGMFYLLTIYCALRSAESRAKYGWYAAATVCCALGMATKPVMVTAPLVVLIFDRTFVSRSFGDALRQRTVLYAALTATWGVLLAILRGGEALVGSGSAGFEMPISSWSYLLTQSTVICHYIRLALWPHPLVFDYAWPLSKSIGEVWPFGLIIAMLLAATGVALWKRSWLGVAGAWFFLILAPTSSFMPIADLAVEHRMYLPLAAVVAVVVLGTHGLLARRLRPPPLVAVSALLLIVAAGGAAIRTVERNEQYKTGLSLWTTVVDTRPGNPRAHFNLAAMWREKGFLDRSLAILDSAEEVMLAADPSVRMLLTYPKLYVERASVWLELAKLPDEEDQAKRRVEKAVAHLDIALDLLVGAGSDMPEYHYTLGMAWMQQGEPAEAEASFRRAIELKPEYLKAHNNLASVLTGQGKYGEAEQTLRQLLAYSPESGFARFNLAGVLLRQNRVDEAVEAYFHTMTTAPFSLEALKARCRLAFLRATHPESRHRNGREALRLAKEVRESSNPEVLNTLAAAYAELGQFDHAVEACERLIALSKQNGAKDDLLQPIRERLELYRKGEPYRYDPAASSAPAPEDGSEIRP